MEGSKVNVRIYGQDYVLAGEESQDRMIRVAAYVDTRMHEVAEGFHDSSKTALAVLSAVNIADEYFNAADRLTELNIGREQMERDLRKYEELWEESKRSLAEHKEESHKVYEERDALRERLSQMEQDLRETIRRQDEDFSRSLREKEGAFLKSLEEKEAEVLELKELLDQATEPSGSPKQGAGGEQGRIKDLEDSIFDLQMENIQLKSEVEKLRSISE